jgi:hypothetical protein
MQHEYASVTREGLVYESNAALGPGDTWQIPALPGLRNGGFSLELWLEVADTGTSQRILGSHGQRHRGFQIATAPDGAIRISLSDARHRHWLDVVDGALDGQPGPAQQLISMRAWTWESDRGALQPGKVHHLVFIVDGLANIVSIVVDGRLCDGGTDRIQGWWRLNPWMDDINDQGICHVAEGFQGRIHRMRLYSRYLRTSEAVGNYQAGLEEAEK